MTTLGERLSAGETVFTAWSGIPDAVTVEAVAGLAFDAVTLDMQHGGHHEDSVLRSILPIRAASKHALVRIPVGRFDMASRALDFGAEAVIAPMVNTVEDAVRFAAAMKYPPIGERSWGPHMAMARIGRADPKSWLTQANAGTLALAMIETREAYDLADEIIAVDGIDGIFVGPSDFSIAWFHGATIDPVSEDMMEAIGTIARKASEAGKHAGIYVPDARFTGRFHAMGYRLFAMGNEHTYMAQGVDNLLATARESLQSASI
jgi:4-hydroxy-2-oxoheptanedioate aldolase